MTFLSIWGTKQQVAHIDFAKITDAKRIAIEFIELYELLSGKTLSNYPLVFSLNTFLVFKLNTKLYRFYLETFGSVRSFVSVR